MFDIQKFENAKYKETTKEIDATCLKSFFEEDEAPFFVIKGLTGLEIAAINEQVQNSEIQKSIVDKLLSEIPSEKISGIKDSLGLTDITPKLYIKVLHSVRLGLVKPKLNHVQTVKLADVASVFFWSLYNEIMHLTGQGKSLGE